MKLVLIVYNEAIDSRIDGLLADCCPIASFTKWTKVMGRGTHSEPHLLDHVWPKGNNALITCVPDDVAGKILNRIREFRAKDPKTGLKAFSLPVDDAT